jgi:two-component system cell cycle sensor histidine kinase/response regulator CckA
MDIPFSAKARTPNAPFRASLRDLLLRYGFALESVGGAIALRMLLQPLFGPRRPYATFAVASLVAAWAGGLGPGIVAAALGALAAGYFFIPPAELFTLEGAVDLVVYLLVSLAGVLLFQAQRRSRQLALENAAVAEERLELVAREARARDEALEKLRRTEHQFALFMRYLPGAAWIKDLEGRYLYANETGERIFSRTLAELRGKTDEEIFPPKTARQFRENDRLALASRQCHQTIESLAHPDGLHHSIVNKFPILGAGGDPVMVGGVAFDITDRLKAEEDLRRSQHQFSTLLDSISDGFIALDREWRFTYVNREAARQARIPAGAMLGQNIWELIPQATTSRFHAELQRAMRERVPVSFEDVYPEHQQWFRIHAYPSEEGLSVFAVEITAQKRAEAATAELAAIVESSDDAILAKTLDGAVTSWNPAAERLYGFSAEEIIGRPASLLVPPERSAEFEAIMERIRLGQPVAPFETQRLRKDGTRVEVSVSVSPITRSDGTIAGASAIARDITERKRLEQHLQQVQKLESLGVLAGGIAHDFNNLLTCVLGNAGLASSEVSPASPAAQFLKEITLASERMADLTRQMLAYAGKGRFLLERVDCSEKVREISVLVRASFPRNVRLDLQLEPGLPLVLGDPAQLHQLIINLIINAAEAIGNENGTVTVRTRLEPVDETYVRTASPVLDTLAPGDYVSIEVEDSGSGMDDDIKARIFDPFFTTKLSGRGLGLSAALGIIRGHRGALDLDSALGKGSRFRVLLPVAEDQTKAQGTAIQSGELSGSGLVLIVDDEEVVRATARASLERYGYTVRVAENGKEALELIELFHEQIALVLLDMTMAVMGGAETLERLKRLAPQIPVLASTAYSETEAMQHFRYDGLCGFIQKPYTPARLAETVKFVLSRKAAPTGLKVAGSPM